MEHIMKTPLLLLGIISFLIFACESEPAYHENCGDGLLDPLEECDGDNNGGTICSDFGYYGGNLSCSTACSFDKSNCIDYGKCGDNIIQYHEGEECDGYSVGTVSCIDQGYSSGELSCDENCKLMIDDCNSECTPDQIFFNSENPNCSPSKKCVIDASSGEEENSIMICRDESEIGRTDFYTPCTTTTGCLHGATCLPVLAQMLCMPICHRIVSPYCPGTGVCIVEPESLDGVGICFDPDKCDPIMDTGCVVNSGIINHDPHCYLLNLDGDGLCVDFNYTGINTSNNSLPVHGENCLVSPDQLHKACAAGHICSDETTTCIRLCHPGNDSECESGETCTTFGVAWLGFCL
jgi:hypothetical protein